MTAARPVEGARMSRKGNYAGGGTVIGPQTGDWFSPDSTWTPVEGAPRELRSIARDAQLDIGPELIKADDPTLAKHRSRRRRKTF